MSRGANSGPAPDSDALQSRRYRLTDVLTGEEYNLLAVQLSAVFGVEIGYIDWCIACDGVFETPRWKVMWT